MKKINFFLFVFSLVYSIPSFGQYRIVRPELAFDINSYKVLAEKPASHVNILLSVASLDSAYHVTFTSSNFKLKQGLNALHTSRWISSDTMVHSKVLSDLGWVETTYGIKTLLLSGSDTLFEETFQYVNQPKVIIHSGSLQDSLGVTLPLLPRESSRVVNEKNR